MLGFKRFRNAAIVIAGVELMHRIRKEQFGLLLNIKGNRLTKAVLTSFRIEEVGFRQQRR